MLKAQRKWGFKRYNYKGYFTGEKMSSLKSKLSKDFLLKDDVSGFFITAE